MELGLQQDQIFLHTLSLSKGYIYKIINYSHDRLPNPKMHFIDYFRIKSVQKMIEYAKSAIMYRNDSFN